MKANEQLLAMNTNTSRPIEWRISNDSQVYTESVESSIKNYLRLMTMLPCLSHVVGCNAHFKILLLRPCRVEDGISESCSVLGRVRAKPFMDVHVSRI
jgi:hypothetical protein